MSPKFLNHRESKDATLARMVENIAFDNLIWPHRDTYIWPHL